MRDSTKPDLRIVRDDSPSRRRKANPDARLRQLIRLRKEHAHRIAGIDAELTTHGRRVADERGQLPRLTIPQLVAEFGR